VEAGQKRKEWQGRGTEIGEAEASEETRLVVERVTRDL